MTTVGLKSRRHMAADFEVKRLQDQCAKYRETIARLEATNKALEERVKRWDPPLTCSSGSSMVK